MRTHKLFIQISDKFRKGLRLCEFMLFSNFNGMNEMDNNLLFLTATVTIATAVIIAARKKRKKKLWSRSWLRRRTRGKGILNMLNNELKVEDPTAYKNYIRLTSTQFNELLNLIEQDITKQETFMREPISARNKLEVTLHFLATGESYRSLMYSTRIHESTISRFVPLVCDAIIKKLMSTYLKVPATVHEWNKIAKDFKNIWNFPNCLGALDGWHINFRAPISDGSFYYNYKGSNSIVLLALADANYKFIYINIGVNGRISDGGVFQASKLSSAISQNTLNFPPANYLPGMKHKTPYVIVADDAFPLSEHIMKPYPHRGLTHEHRIFNYRLSRARRVVENSFGILANRFRVLLNPINLSATKVEKITLACVILHNYLCTMNGQTYIDFDAGMEVIHLQVVGHQGSNHSTTSARNIREEYTKYFNSPYGSVEWQENAVQNNNL